MKKAICVLLLLALVLPALGGCAAKTENTPDTTPARSGEPGRKSGDAPELQTYADLSGKTVSMLTGAPFGDLVRSKAPDVKEFSYYNSTPDLLLALGSRKTDAVLINNAIADLAVNRNDGLALFPQNLRDGVFGFAFRKGDPEREKWQAAYDTISREEKQALWEKWTGSDDSVKTLPEQDWPGRNGTVQAAVCDTLEPMSYAGPGGELVGFDLEMILRMARELDVHVEFTGMEFSAIMTTVQAGKAAIGAGSIIVTEERRESVDFIEYYPAAFVLIVRAAKTAGETGCRTLADFAGKRIGVVTGAIQGPAIEKQIPTAELSYYNSVPDLLTALKSGKIDAFAAADQIIRYLMIEDDDLTYLDEPLTATVNTGVIFPKTQAGAALRSEFNAWLAQARVAGMLDEVEETWLGRDDSKKTVLDISTLSGEKGKLTLATDAAMVPNSYVKDNAHVGMDIDLILRFCRERGYALEITDMSFSGLIDAVVTGKCHFAAGAIAHTPERAESVDFSDPLFQSYSVLAYLKTGETGQTAKTPDDYAKAKIGVLTGTNFPEVVKARLPEAEILYFNTTADVVNALKTGKVEAVAFDEPVARSIQAENEDLMLLPELLDSQDYAVALVKSDRGEALCRELSDFLQGLKETGELRRLQDKWFDTADLSRVEMEDYRTLPNENGTVKLAAFVYPPFIVQREDALAGYEMELMTLFCRERGYALEVMSMTNDAVLPAVQSGKCDAAACSISVTEERKESMLFSRPDYSGGTALLVRRESAGQEQESFFRSVAESFEKTFLRENRWKLFVEGIGTTMLITVTSVLLGTALGFGVYLLCRNGNPVPNGIARFFVWLVQGMPVVVLLMILYYVIFGKVAVSGTIVAIVGFTLVFASGVFGMVKSGVGAVDRGQTEAAWALGYSDRRAFFRVVLPQALPHFFPAYKGEITALIKATAIVGYVAVQDLTKMGDIVRSRTFEAFFPLIAVAIIYFILAGILTAIVNRLGVLIDPRLRRRESAGKGAEEK